MGLSTLKPRVSTQPKRINTETPRRTGSWLQKERKQLFKDQPLCVECLKVGRIREATERDHIIELADGGKDERSNTQALCEECNDMKAAAQMRRRRGGG